MPDLILAQILCAAITAAAHGHGAACIMPTTTIEHRAAPIVRVKLGGPVPEFHARVKRHGVFIGVTVRF